MNIRAILKYRASISFYFEISFPLFLEVLSPQRPPAPPTEYLQVNIGGYDTDSLLSVSNRTRLTGFVGCIRGLKIGDNVITLVNRLNNNTNNSGS